MAIIKLIFNFFKENIVPSIIAAAVLVFIIVGSVTRCTQINAPAAVAARQQAEEADPEDDADEKLGYAVADRAAYTEVEQDIIDLLRANLWVGSSTDSVSCEFTERTFTEKTEGSAAEAEAFVIEAVGEEQTTFDDAGGKSVDTLICMKTASWRGFSHLVRDYNSKGGITAVRISCPAFQLSGTYMIAAAARSVEIDGPSVEWLERRGLSREALCELIGSWCGLNYPTVSEASWTKTSTSDYENGFTTIEYVLNDRDEKSITVVIDDMTKEMRIEE